MAAGEQPPNTAQPSGADRGPPRGAAQGDPRSARGRLGPVSTNARCNRCRDRSFRVDTGLIQRLETGAVERSTWRPGLRFTPTPSLRPPSIRRSRRLGVRGCCTRGSRRSSAIRRKQPATWPCPSRARTAHRRPARGGSPAGLLPGSAAIPRPSSGRSPATASPQDRGEDLARRTHPADVAHYECGDPSLARSVLEQAVDLSMAGPTRARVLLDLSKGLAEDDGWRAAWAVFEAARGEAGDDLQRCGR